MIHSTLPRHVTPPPKGTPVCNVFRAPPISSTTYILKERRRPCGNDWMFPAQLAEEEAIEAAAAARAAEAAAHAAEEALEAAKEEERIAAHAEVVVAKIEARVLSELMWAKAKECGHQMDKEKMDAFAATEKEKRAKRAAAKAEEEARAARREEALKKARSGRH